MFVCLTLLASFFLPSHLSFKNMYIHGCFALFVCLILLASFFLPSHLSFKNMYTKNKQRSYNNVVIIKEEFYIHVHVQ